MESSLFPSKSPVNTPLNLNISVPSHSLTDPKGLPEETLKLINAYNEDILSGGGGQPTIKVNNATSILAFFYEKIRNAVEYKDEHLLRRAAIERILRRRFSQKNAPLKISLPLLRELVRARYLKNDSVPEAKITEVGLLIAKYQRLLEEIEGLQAKTEASKLTDWFIQVLSAEIEGVLVSDTRREALVEVMYRFLDRNLKEKGKVTQETRRLQLYIATQRALLKSDDALLRLRLLEFYFPDWAGIFPNFDSEQGQPYWEEGSLKRLKGLAENSSRLMMTIEEQLNDTSGLRLLYFLKKHTAPFLILRDVVEENPAAALERFKEPVRLEETVRRICRKRYDGTKAKVSRMVVRAIIYIFLTKMIFGLILEGPADIFIYKKVVIYPLLINALFPPFLMFLIATTIKVPGEDNTRIIHLKIRSILFNEPYFQEGDRALTFSWQPAVRGSFLLNSFRTIYLLAFVITFGTIIQVLRLIHFNPVSIAIFLFFLCVVALFGYAIRRSASELSTVGRGENLISPLIDFFFLPILRVGRWLSLEISRWNFLTYFFDFIIEAPLKSFIEIAEEWLAFVKEKKEELA